MGFLFIVLEQGHQSHCIHLWLSPPSNREGEVSLPTLRAKESEPGDLSHLIKFKQPVTVRAEIWLCFFDFRAHMVFPLHFFLPKGKQEKCYFEDMPYVSCTDCVHCTHLQACMCMHVCIPCSYKWISSIPKTVNESYTYLYLKCCWHWSHTWIFRW